MVVIIREPLQQTRQEDSFQPLQQKIADLVVKARSDLEAGSGGLVNERIGAARAELEEAKKQALKVLSSQNHPASLELPTKERVEQMGIAIRCLDLVQSFYGSLEIGNNADARYEIGRADGQLALLTGMQPVILSGFRAENAAQFDAKMSNLADLEESVLPPVSAPVDAREHLMAEYNALTDLKEKMSFVALGQVDPDLFNNMFVEGKLSDGEISSVNSGNALPLLRCFLEGAQEYHRTCEEFRETAVQGQTDDEPPNFGLGKRNVEMLTSRILAESKAQNLEELMKDEKLLFKSLLKVLTRRRKNPAYVDGIGLTGEVDVQAISNGTILRTSSNQIGKIEVGEVISKGNGYSEFYAEVPGYGIERCRVEKGKDGFVFSVMGFSEDATAEPDPAKRKTRNPEKTFEEAKGDCDEFALLAASYLKAIGFNGKVTLAEIRLTTGPNEDYSKNAQDHAFMIGVENRQGIDTFYRMDFTLKEKFEEFKVVRKSDGQIDGMASVAANYAPGELMEGQQRVKRAILHEGLDAIEAYPYQVKAAHLFNRLQGEIPINNLSPSEDEINKISKLRKIIDAGLQINNSNSDLYLILGQADAYWAATLSEGKNSNTIKLIETAKENFRCAFELDQLNDNAHYQYGLEIFGTNREEALQHVSIALTINPANMNYAKSMKNLSNWK